MFAVTSAALAVALFGLGWMLVLFARGARRGLGWALALVAVGVVAASVSLCVQALCGDHADEPARERPWMQSASPPSPTGGETR